MSELLYVWLCDRVRSVSVCCIIGLVILVGGRVPIANAAEDTEDNSSADPFAQIDSILPTPSETRLATGAPGPKYWQQQVDYKIEVTLDETRKRIIGAADIHYQNNSPHELRYLWLQLDANRFTPSSDLRLARSETAGSEMSVDELQRLLATTFDGGVKIRKLNFADEQPLEYTVVKGMLRVDLPAPLSAGAAFDFSIAWEFAINDSKLVPGRTGYEMFDDGNAIFCIAQWYPRLCAYTDYGGWRHKQFMRAGEFTLEFGNFDVKISVPADHVLLATGALVNGAEVLNETQQQRLTEALKSETPIFVVTAEEAAAAEKAEPSEDYKTWHFQAERVRDFAFASSRKFLWDACGQPVGERTVLCMSLYPKEGMPLWNQYSTHAIAHTVEVYSRYTGIDYPYPHATAVMGVIGGGMEYPMICFNGPRPEKDGTYSDAIKNRVIGVIIHEVGHNWFPMIVNNDERHWMWLDEGFNSFVQTIAQREWEDDEDYSRAEPRSVVSYMKAARQRSIMTHPDSLYNVGANAYGKTSTGLTILRETILGRELFDFAFKEYCRRWAYKRPEPSDFFRTMEDAAGLDLDWFWNGWFYTTNSCDFALVNVEQKLFNDGDPTEDKDRELRKKAEAFANLIREREAGMPRRIEKYEQLRDFYDDYDPQAVTEKKTKAYEAFRKRLNEQDKAALETIESLHLYQVTVANQGDLVMPLILKLIFVDDTSEIRRFPAEVWRKDAGEVSRLLLTPQPLKAVLVDPYHETADIDLTNNRFPRQIGTSDLKITKPKKSINNPLKQEQDRQRKAAQGDKKAESDSASTTTPPPSEAAPE